MWLKPILGNSGPLTLLFFNRIMQRIIVVGINGINANDYKAVQLSSHRHFEKNRTHNAWIHPTRLWDQNRLLDILLITGTHGFMQSVPYPNISARKSCDCGQLSHITSVWRHDANRDTLENFLLYPVESELIFWIVAWCLLHEAWILSEPLFCVCYQATRLLSWSVKLDVGYCIEC